MLDPKCRGCGARRGSGNGRPLVSSQGGAPSGIMPWLCATATRRTAHANCVRFRPSPASGNSALTLFQICAQCGRVSAGIAAAAQLAAPASGRASCVQLWLHLQVSCVHVQWES